MNNRMFKQFVHVFFTAGTNGLFYDASHCGACETVHAGPLSGGENAPALGQVLNKRHQFNPTLQLSCEKGCCWFIVSQGHDAYA